ncbi:hypothetical protein PWP93_35875 [Paraburkholderia sp. A1RI-2L]|uniref:hypothetical protein n=1 Tax=Paraburkholderia sp. A1RI-2L TaxID=3028367 RepID=UPI003B8053D5
MNLKKAKAARPSPDGALLPGKPVILGLVLAGVLAVLPFVLYELNVGNTVPAQASAPPAAAPPAVH